MAIYKNIQARKAPLRNTKIPYWVKRNLFSSVLSSILTILALYLIYIITPALLNWLIFNATWSGTKESIVNEGARWIFIFEKFNLFMYGFYPKELYWRPNLVIFIFVFCIFIFKKTDNRKIKALILLMVPIVAYILIVGAFGLQPVNVDKFGGLLLTLIIAFFGIVVSFPLGILFGLGRQSNMPIIKLFSVIYIELLRGLPLILLLFISSVILPLFFPEGVHFNKLLRALIIIIMFQSAYLAEIIRGGLNAVDKGQYEAADTLGLNYWKKMGFVILPQALKISIPNIVGQFIASFKDTSLVLIIGLFDILAMVTLTTSDPNWLGFETEGYVFVALVYWVICFCMSKYAAMVATRYNTEKK